MRGLKSRRRPRVLVATLAAAVAVTGLVSLPLQPRAEAIVGGKVAIAEYPFIVALKRSSGNAFCTGVLIDALWVATAAHCTTGRKPASLRLTIGANNHTADGDTVRAQRIVKAPGADLSLVQLSSPVSQQPISIADAAPVGEKVLVLGFGLTCPVRGCGPSSKRLNELQLSIGSDAECGEAINNGKNEICLPRPEKSQGVCFGDSGGPAVIRGESGFLLVGIANRITRARCGTGSNIYADITAFKSSITELLGSQ